MVGSLLITSEWYSMMPSLTFSLKHFNLLCFMMISIQQLLTNNISAMQMVSFFYSGCYYCCNGLESRLIVILL
ncbi:hypothetical protein MKX01_002042 [Papaver californicum]|nr:hypothetical protein MKX01_002042 [Papaver californicum]